MEEKTGRRRGGQPGNTNALKHGFYSKYFRTEEARDVEALVSEGLQEEIATLRVISRRVLQLSEGMTDLEVGLRVLNAFGAAATRISSLIKVQKIILGEDEDEDSFEDALRIAIMEWHEKGEQRRKAREEQEG
jgi:hypothetical protein